MVERVAAGAITPEQVKAQGERFLAQHAPEFLSDVMSLGLTFVGRLQQSSSALADGLYERVLGPDRDDSASVEPPVCVDLRAPSGGTASACIVVENTQAGPAEVVCRVSL